MKIEALQTFIDIVASRNFNKVADQLNVSQSTVSTRIKILEETLGQRLFRRSRAGVELTATGRALVPYAEAMVVAWQKARQRLALPTGYDAILTIGAVPELWCDFLLDWVTTRRRTHPKIAVNAQVGPPQTLQNRLREGVLDVAVMYEPSAGGTLQAMELFQDELILVSTENRQLIRWDPNYIYLHWGDRIHDVHARSYEINDTPIAAFDNGSLGLQYLLANGGSAYLPERMVKHHIAEKKLFAVPQAPMFPLGVFAVTASSAPLPDWLDEALEDLKRLGAKLGAA